MAGATIPNDVACHDNPAAYTQQAQPDAVDFQILAAARAGTCVIYGCAVTVHSGGTALDVAAGRITILGVEVAVAAQTSIAITAGDAANPREDLVVVNASGTASIVTGTAAIQACFPSLAMDGNGDYSTVGISALHVPANATTVTGSNLTDKRMLSYMTPLASGWTAERDAATRVTGSSNVKSTFTLPIDLTARYKRGTRLRWYESGTVKYGVVCIDSTQSSGTTTVTLTGNTDYAMAASPDDGVIFYSYQDSPLGYPHWFNYTPTWAGGFSTAPSGGTNLFELRGHTATVRVSPTVAGTANTTAVKTVSVPDGLGAALQAGGPCFFAQDNNVNQTLAIGVINTAATTISIFKDATETANPWTSAAGWEARLILSFAC